MCLPMIAAQNKITHDEVDGGAGRLNWVQDLRHKLEKREEYNLHNYVRYRRNLSFSPDLLYGTHPIRVSQVYYFSGRGLRLVVGDIDFPPALDQPCDAVRNEPWHSEARARVWHELGQGGHRRIRPTHEQDTPGPK